MYHHELKIHPRYYDAVKAGSKTFEYRINDRGFQSGDIVTLMMHDGVQSLSCEANPPLTFRIGFVLQIPNSEYCVFSIIED